MDTGNTTERKNRRKKRGRIINTIIGGRLFANEMLRRNAALFALIVFYSFIYVSNRYEYERVSNCGWKYNQLGKYWCI